MPDNLTHTMVNLLLFNAFIAAVIAGKKPGRNNWGQSKVNYLTQRSSEASLCSATDD